MALVVNICLCCFCYFSLSVISTSHQHATFLDVVRGTIAVEVEFDGGIWAVSIEAGGKGYRAYKQGGDA